MQSKNNDRKRSDSPRPLTPVGFFRDQNTDITKFNPAHKDGLSLENSDDLVFYNSDEEVEFEELADKYQEKHVENKRVDLTPKKTFMKTLFQANTASPQTITSSPSTNSLSSSK